MRIGSPTCWLKTSVPVRSYLKSEAAGRILKDKRVTCFVVSRRYCSINLDAVTTLGAAQGGAYVDGTHWAFAGGQIRSLLSLLSYLGKGQQNDHYLGVKIPPTNLQAEAVEQARTFATGLVDRLTVSQAAEALTSEMAAQGSYTADCSVLVSARWSGKAEELHRRYDQQHGRDSDQAVVCRVDREVAGDLYQEQHRRQEDCEAHVVCPPSTRPTDRL